MFAYAVHRFCSIQSLFQHYCRRPALTAYGSKKSYLKDVINIKSLMHISWSSNYLGEAQVSGFGFGFDFTCLVRGIIIFGIDNIINNKICYFYKQAKNVNVKKKLIKVVVQFFLLTQPGQHEI